MYCWPCTACAGRMVCTTRCVQLVLQRCLCVMSKLRYFSAISYGILEEMIDFGLDRDVRNTLSDDPSKCQLTGVRREL
eukprot:5854274-Amphidinium_carterae.1